MFHLFFYLIEIRKYHTRTTARSHREKSIFAALNRGRKCIRGRGVYNIESIIVYMLGIAVAVLEIRREV